LEEAGEEEKADSAVAAEAEEEEDFQEAAREAEEEEDFQEEERGDIELWLGKVLNNKELFCLDAFIKIALCSEPRKDRI
jgi:hypothetical protein